jgi:uncharacterized surface anchored protein
MRLLEANGGIQIDGWDFMTVQDVLDQTEPGSLLRHTLALQLNVWLAEENDCDLSSVVFNSEGNEFDGQTVGDILAAALDILASGDPAFAESGNGGYADLHEAIDLINNASHTDDGTLTCEGTSAGAGFMFELYGPDDPELLADSGTTDESGMLTFSDLAFGTYTLVETGGSGEEECSIVSASGDGVTFDPETGVITIVIDETNTDVTVTVVNECGGESGGETGSITIIKNAVPDAAQDFAFTTSANLTGFSLDDDADATLANQETFTGLLAGSYSVAESMTAGWTLTSITCSAGGTADLASRTANITLAEGADVTCTFVNTQEGQQTETGSITILKNAVPDDAQDFVFTTTGTGLSGFSLDDDANATLSNQKTFSGLAAGMYTVAEGSVTGWTLTSLTCSPSTAVSVTGSMASITLAAGANVTCTFVNTKQGSGTLPNQGGPKTGEGTLAGQLPNTATEPFNGTSMPVALVALLMLSGLGAAAYAMKADSARRR